jgi:hypothetical protein
MPIKKERVLEYTSVLPLSLPQIAAAVKEKELVKFRGEEYNIRIVFVILEAEIC